MGSAAQQLVNHQAIRAVFSAVFALTERVIRDSKHFNLTYAAVSVQHVSFGQSGQLLRPRAEQTRQWAHCKRDMAV
jgi:hypothetical protein